MKNVCNHAILEFIQSTRSVIFWRGDWYKQLQNHVIFIWFLDVVITLYKLIKTLYQSEWCV